MLLRVLLIGTCFIWIGKLSLGIKPETWQVVQVLQQTKGGNELIAMFVPLFVCLYFTLDGFVVALEFWDKRKAQRKQSI